jgi:hypothetical protein
MWSFRRELPCHNTWNGAPADVGFVTVFSFVQIPLEEAELVAHSARFTPNEQLPPLRQFEAFVCGFSSGVVLRCEVIASSYLSSLLSAEASRLVVALHRHQVASDNSEDASCDVMGLATLGTITASVAGDRICRVSFFYPATDAICSLPHSAGLRSVLLHEGKKSWSDRNGDAESVALYVFTGDDAGVVRLWRVDVVEKTYFLHTVLVAGVFGSQGESSLVDAHNLAASARLIGKPIYCLAVDGNVEEAERLVATTDGHLLCFDCRRVMYKSTEMNHSILDRSPEASAAGAQFVSAKVEVQRLAGVHVWCKSDVTVLKVLREYELRSEHNDPGQEPPTPVTKWKSKHEKTVSSGLNIGCVSNEPFLAPTAAPCDALITAVFPGLTNAAVWPVGALEPCLLPALVATVDREMRPVFSVAVCGGGRLVTGDAAGHVKVWQFDDAARPFGRYDILYDVPNAHDGHLVKVVAPLRRPDVFVSFGYDGSFREWHIVDAAPEACCLRANVVTVADPLKASNDGSDKMGLCWGAVSEEFGAVFAVSLFEASVRTYAFLPCDTCEIPPGFIYNGINTVKIC